ncbi:MAG: tetratricopeptide repeat protein [Methylobacteriaceae bacterium]|nr:tetratricopeptide repeat protein [Methylobacteriaceae bacterium]MBV9243733.1 tetratricopeptide repeat protein [Methylobacteriaceae bacterium]
MALGGCVSVGDVTGSTSPASSELPRGDAALRSYADEWGRKFEANPGDRTASLNYGRALRALSRYNEAVAVLQAGAIKNPRDTALLGAYGKSLSDVGRFPEASEVLSRAHTPERPDWTILSAEGTVADQMGEFDRAQGFYSAALKIVPGEPTVLANLGLSYALQKRLPEAEKTLRQATSDPRADVRVRQDLALVLALQGKFDEAEQVSERDLPPKEAAANVIAIREMIAQSDTWKEIRKMDAKSRATEPRLPKAAAAETPAQ